jgi:hypothetical protein
MKIITSRDRVRRYEHTREFKTYQVLIRYYYIFGIKFWYEHLDREDIPSHVLIACGCFGGYDSWKSKFAPFDKEGWK